MLDLLVAAALLMAFIALTRSSSLRAEIAMLRHQVGQLEEQITQQTLATVPYPESTNAPSALPETSEILADPAPAFTPPPSELSTTITPTPLVLPDKPKQTENKETVFFPAHRQSAFNGIISSLLRWSIQGNPLAKLGILLLFLGLAFLLRYTVEHALFPLELRLIATAAGAIGLLGVGWRLRFKKPVYALILQGGALGALYLIVFGAFRLWQMLPLALTISLLILICAASVGLAILQKSLSLAMLASLGGYLTPLLISTGSSNHIALFSLYLLLSIGILAISVWQHWRELNLLGLLFTFGVGGFWGLNSYQTEHWLSSQLFLIANVLLFGVISVLLSLRAQKTNQALIDGVFLFAPPLIGFGMQYAITQHMAYGPAFSALGYGCFYLIFGWFTWHRYRLQGRLLALATLALGATFTTLAIPLAFSSRWTAMAWAVEGLGILWLGISQQQRSMSYSGTALMTLALNSALWALIDGEQPASIVMIFSVLSLCWLAGAWLWRGADNSVSHGMLATSLVCWLATLISASQWALTHVFPTWFGTLTLIALSALLWRYLSQRLAWPELGLSPWLLWSAMLGMLAKQIEQQQIFAAGWQNLAWCVALPCALNLLYRDSERLPLRISQALHISLFWMIVCAFGMQLYWFTQSLPWNMAAWRGGLLMAAGGITIVLSYAAIRHQLWPFKHWSAPCDSIALAPVAALLSLLLVATNVQDGIIANQIYLPLLNPLEMGAAFALSGLYLFNRLSLHLLPARHRLQAHFALLALIFWWLNGALLRVLATYSNVAWQIADLWQSSLIQTCFTLFWTLTALTIMLFATNRQSRQQWLCGAFLLGLAIAKLMLIDSAGGGGLARSIAFIGTAILLLIVGYFSPLPPKDKHQCDESMPTANDTP